MRRQVLCLVAVASLCASHVDAGPDLLVTTVPGTSGDLYRVDAFTATATLVGGFLLGSNPEALTGIAVHPLTGSVYGSTAPGSLTAGHLVLVDTSTAHLADLGAFGTQQTMDDITFAPDGTLYGFSDTSLYTIDLGTGVATLAGTPSLGQVTGSRGLAFIPPFGPGAKLFLTPSGDAGSLYELNPANGQVVSTQPLQFGSGYDVGGLSSNLGGDRLLGVRADSRLVEIDPGGGYVAERGVLPGSADGVAVAESLAGEFQAHVDSFEAQYAPDVAMDASGAFVLVWQTLPSEGQADVYLRRFAFDTTPLTRDVRVSPSANDDEDPAVASAADGRFVVVWTSAPYPYGAGDIRARLFSSAGTPGPVFTVAATTADEREPDVAMAASGDFVVTWTGEDAEDHGIRARRYAADGTPRASAFRVNSAITGSQAYPAVAMAADGSFVVAWTTPDSWGGGIRARGFDAAGAPRGPEFAVDDGGRFSAIVPSVAADAAGNFTVAWAEQYFSGPGLPSSPPAIATSGSDILARRYASTLAPRSDPTVVNLQTSYDQKEAAVASDADGNVIITWASDAQDGAGVGVISDAVQADGESRTGGGVVPEFTTGDQWLPVAALAAGRDPVWAWLTPGEGRLAISVRRSAFGRSISVMNPRAGASWAIGALRRANWVFTPGAEGPFDVTLDRTVSGIPGTEGPLNASALDAVSLTHGQFDWPVTGPESDPLGAQLEVASALDTVGRSPAFTIEPGFLRNLAPPASGAVWLAEETRRIWFEHNLGAGALVTIELSRNGGGTWELLDPAYALPGGGRTSYDWVVTGPQTGAGQARLRLTWKDDPLVTATSAAFEIRVGTLRVSRPSLAGIDFGAGSTQSVVIEHNLTAGATVRLDLSTDGGATFPLAIAPARPVAGTTGSLTYRWTVPNLPGSSHIIRAIWNQRPTVTDDSDHPFTISAARLQVIRPTAAAPWTVGAEQQIQWRHNLGTGTASRVQIELCVAGEACEVLVTGQASSLPTLGSYRYTPTETAEAALVRITWLVDGTLTDDSGTFSIH